MIDEHIDYKAKADEVFKYFEEKVFERSRYDIDRDYDLIFSFSDWVRDLDTGYILEIVDFDLKDFDDVEKACEKLIKIINNGVDKWLGNPVDELIKDLKGAA